MINVDVAFDERDAVLGEYFRRCKEDLLEFLRVHNHLAFTVREINSLLSNAVYLDAQMPMVNGRNFFFIAYSHGEVDCLLANDSAYVDSRAASTNIHLFINSFFYCVACLAGTELGPSLVNNAGSHVFIGYRGSHDVLLGYLDLSIELANMAIKMFVIGQTVADAYRLAIQRHDQRIDHLVKFHDPLAASILVQNRTNLVLIGREDLTINDFELV